MKNDFFHIRPIGFGLAVLGFLTVMPSWASGRQQLQGHVPADVATALMVGDVDDSQSLHLAVGLPLRHQDDLKSLIQNLYDPHSSQYRRYLTPDQFAQMFGPTPEDYQKLREFFESNGLSVVGTSPNRLLLDLTATAADARRVFHVTLHNYRRADGTQFYAPDSEPSVDLDLPISRVSGLDNAAAPHSNLILKGPVEINPAGGSTGLKRSPNTGTGPGGTYWGSDFRNIYVPCTSQTGTGQNIALFELDTYKAANITNYENDTGIGSPSLTKVTVGNAIKRPGSGEVEVELDIEMAMSMAPGAGIYVYENPGDSSAELDDLLNAIANPTSPNPLCYEISSSWSWTGNFDENVPPIFQQYAAQGQSFFEASGDLGAYVADDPQTTVPYPIAETGLITAVGGTALSTNGSGGSLGTYTSETTWNDSPGPSTTKTPAPNAVSSGGICNSSTPIPIPTYQVSFVNGTSGASSSFRNMPDVAMVADNIGIYTTNGTKSGTFSSGGTSAAAPLWAALTALINEQAASGSAGPIGLLNPAIYNLASNAATYANDFHDIADGSTNNYWGSAPASFESVTGYDLTTGLGSPQCNLINDMAGYVVARGTNTLTATPSSTPMGSPTNTGINTTTNTPTKTTTNSPTNTATNTDTHTAVNTATNTSTNTPTNTSINTNTATNTTTNTATNTATQTATNTFTNTNTATNTVTQTATNTATNTPTNTYTNTNTAINTATQTATNTAANTVTNTFTNTNTATNSATQTAINTATNTPLNTFTNTNTASNTATQTVTNTATNTFTNTFTNTNTATNTVTQTETNTATNTPTNTVAETATNTTTNTFTNTNTATNTATQTTTNTATNSATNTFTNTNTATNSTTNTATNTATQTGTNTATNTPLNTFTNTDTGTNTATQTAVNTATNTATNTLTATSSSTPVGTPTQTVTYTITSTATNALINTATPTPISTLTQTATMTSSNTPMMINTPTPTLSAISTVSSTPTASGLLLSALAEPNISPNGEPIKFVIDLGGNATIQLSLFSLLSEEIFSETIQGNAGLNTITWSLKNQGQAPVASGLYIYVIEVNNGSETATKTGKVMVIH